MDCGVRYNTCRMCGQVPGAPGSRGAVSAPKRPYADVLLMMILHVEEPFCVSGSLRGIT